MAIELYKNVSNFGSWGLTPEGGVYMTYTNRTGFASVKGTIVIASSNFDNAVETAPHRF